jgi:hypothetical protein
MRFRHLPVAIAVCAMAFGQSRILSVQTLVEMVRSAITLKNPDRDLAAYIATVHLTNRLEEQTVRQLQSLGAGPRTVAALRVLEHLTAQMPSVAVTFSDTEEPAHVQQPPPPEEQQRSILAELREYALNYAKTLPDFICFQVTRRSVDPLYEANSEGSWMLLDRIVEKLSYFERKEKYEPITVNERAMPGMGRESLGGAISSGEFGSLLLGVFEPRSDAHFDWDHWAQWDSTLCYVFRYRVDQARSRYKVDYKGKEQISPGYHGLVYVVYSEPHAVMRLTIEPEIPDTFPVQDVHHTVNYKYAEIGGQKFLLPATSIVQSMTARLGSRNEIEFRQYQKYGADTQIQFDDPPGQPDQKDPATPNSP